MLAAARSGKVAAIVVLHTSRFARNALVSREYKDELRQRGVEVHRHQRALQSVERAATVRGAIKRLTDAYTWGALGEADYREQLRELQAQLEHLDTAPDERRMMTAIRVAQDLAATWERARPERRKQLVAELFDTIRVGGGRIVSVKSKAAVMPLVAVTVSDIEGKDWRSRPGLGPGHRTLWPPGRGARGAPDHASLRRLSRALPVL